MRQIITILIALLIATFAFEVSAQKPYGNELTFALKNGEVVVTGYSGKPTSVYIPKMLNLDGREYPVTQIGSSAFKNCQSLIFISIPECITTIGAHVSYGCSRLGELHLPNGLKR